LLNSKNTNKKIYNQNRSSFDDKFFEKNEEKARQEPGEIQG
jgi:hypothetical protein